MFFFKENSSKWAPVIPDISRSRGLEGRCLSFGSTMSLKVFFLLLTVNQLISSILLHMNLANITCSTYFFLLKSIC